MLWTCDAEIRAPLCMSRISFCFQTNPSLSLYWCDSHVHAVCAFLSTTIGVILKVSSQEGDSMQQKNGTGVKEGSRTVLQTDFYMPTCDWLLEQPVFFPDTWGVFRDTWMHHQVCGPRATRSPSCRNQRAEQSSEGAHSSHVRGKCFLNMGGLVPLHVIWLS